MLGRALTLAALLAFAAAPAYADVDLFVTVYKQKDVTITETIDKKVDVFIDVTVDIDVLKSAEADAIINQTNRNNEACENCAEKSDTIHDSANLNSGIVTINQAAGNNNNQGSAIAVAVDVEVGDDPGTGTDHGFGHAQSHVEQINELNLVDAVNLLFRDALIEDSVNNNTGVVHVNQAAGNNNNQANALSVGFSLAGDGVALAEADLGQVNQNNQVFESDFDGDATDFIGVTKTAIISNSVNDNTGVIGVNQTAGNMANQGNVVAVAAAQ